MSRVVKSRRTVLTIIFIISAGQVWSIDLVRELNSSIKESSRLSSSLNFSKGSNLDNFDVLSNLKPRRQAKSGAKDNKHKKEKKEKTLKTKKSKSSKSKSSKSKSKSKSSKLKSKESKLTSYKPTSKPPTKQPTLSPQNTLFNTNVIREPLTKQPAFTSFPSNSRVFEATKKPENEQQTNVPSLSNTLSLRNDTLLPSTVSSKPFSEPSFNQNYLSECLGKNGSKVISDNNIARQTINFQFNLTTILGSNVTRLIRDIEETLHELILEDFLTCSNFQNKSNSSLRILLEKTQPMNSTAMAYPPPVGVSSLPDDSISNSKSCKAIDISDSCAVVEGGVTIFLASGSLTNSTILYYHFFRFIELSSNKGKFDSINRNITNIAFLIENDERSDRVNSFISNTVVKVNDLNMVTVLLISASFCAMSALAFAGFKKHKILELRKHNAILQSWDKEHDYDFDTISINGTDTVSSSCHECFFKISDIRNENQVETELHSSPKKAVRETKPHETILFSLSNPTEVEITREILSHSLSSAYSIGSHRSYLTPDIVEL